MRGYVFLLKLMRLLGKCVLNKRSYIKRSSYVYFFVDSVCVIINVV